MRYLRDVAIHCWRSFSLRVDPTNRQWAYVVFGGMFGVFAGAFQYFGLRSLDSAMAPATLGFACVVTGSYVWILTIVAMERGGRIRALENAGSTDAANVNQ